MTTASRPFAIYYEHPDWFRPLFAELDQRGVNYVRVNARIHYYDPTGPDREYSLWFNRMSPSAYLRGAGRSIFYTLSFLDYLEKSGNRVINGTNAFRVETSKALQLSLLHATGLRSPTSRVINDPSQAATAARALRFPVVVKPNVGGSGAGVRRFDTLEDLATAVGRHELELGLDGAGLVQEFIPPRGGYITRVEVLGAKFLYAIRVYLSGEGYNLCPADICLTTGGVELTRAACPAEAAKNRLQVEGYKPPREVIDAVERIMNAAEIEIGGVEYIVDDRDGQIYYYDVNALSNFVADAPRVVGFDPFVRVADYLEQEAAR